MLRALSSRLLQLLGYTVAQIQSSQDLIATLIHPDDTEAVLKHYKRFEFFRNDEVRSIEYRARHANGEWLWLSCFEMPLSRGAGEIPRQVLGCAFDINERKSVAAELMAYRKLYEYAPVAFHEIDHNGKVTKVNRAECELLGYDSKEIVGKSIWNFVAPEQRSLSKIKVQRKLAGLDPIVPFTRNYMTKEGRTLEVAIVENLTRDDRNQIIGISSVMIPVPDREIIQPCSSG